MGWPRIGTLLLSGWLAIVADRARAQGSAGFQDIDTSIRSSGMGGATTAVTWGEPGVWGNPASLASVRGIAWLEGRTRLLPEIDPPVRFKTRRFLFGGAGLGVSLTGEPRGLGHTQLEYHETGGTDPFGNPVVGPAHTDESRGWGFAVSPVQLFDAIRSRTSPDAKPLAGRFDVSAGYHHKKTKVTLTSDITAEAENYDWGVLAKAAIGPGDAADPRLELSAGYADLNSDESSHFVFPGYGDQGPSTHIRRTGVAVRALLPFGDAAAEGRPGAWPGSLTNAVSLGVAYDHDERSVYQLHAEPIEHLGFEGAFMDILSVRAGYLNDPNSEIHRVTAGAGVHLPIGPWATVGYDWANDPSVPGMKNENRHGISLWLHPDAIWRSWQDSQTGD